MTSRAPAFAPRRLAPLVAAVAVVIGVLSATVERGELSGVDGPDRPAPVSLALIALVVGAWLVEARGARWPRPLFVAAVALPVAWFVYVGRNASAPMFLILLVGWVALTGTRWEAMLALAAALLAVLLPLPWAAGEYLDWLGWLFGITFAWLSTLALATQQRLLSELRAAQADLARRSAAQERQRIAREVHDVIAHSLAITMLHLTGARHILARDPQRAAEALAQAERLGRQSLADIRRTVGLLSAGSDDRAGETAVAPLPGGEDIPALVDEYRRAGLDVRLSVDGDPNRLVAAAGLELYRIVQEALANAARHAPGARVTVEFAIGAEAVTLRVRDDGPRAGATPLVAGGSGPGLLGMRERATLLGGTLTAGPHDGGWLIDCSIPASAAIAG